MALGRDFIECARKAGMDYVIAENGWGAQWGWLDCGTDAERRYLFVMDAGSRYQFMAGRSEFTPPIGDFSEAVEMLEKAANGDSDSERGRHLRIVAQAIREKMAGPTTDATGCSFSQQQVAELERMAEGCKTVRGLIRKVRASVR